MSRTSSELEQLLTFIAETANPLPQDNVEQLRAVQHKLLSEALVRISYICLSSDRLFNSHAHQLFSLVQGDPVPINSDSNTLANATTETLSMLSPLFTQFLAWQRLMQINKVMENYKIPPISVRGEDEIPCRPRKKRAKREREQGSDEDIDHHEAEGAADHLDRSAVISAHPTSSPALFALDSRRDGEFNDGADSPKKALTGKKPKKPRRGRPRTEAETSDQDYEFSSDTVGSGFAVAPMASPVTTTNIATAIVATKGPRKWGIQLKSFNDDFNLTFEKFPISIGRGKAKEERIDLNLSKFYQLHEEMRKVSHLHCEVDLSNLQTGQFIISCKGRNGMQVDKNPLRLGDHVEFGPEPSVIQIGQFQITATPVEL